MKSLLWAGLLVFSMVSFANDAKNEWHNTTLTEETIKKIQEAKYKYNKCVVTEMRKIDYIKADSRNATDSIMKSCEPVLAQIRSVYLEEKVPEVIADRHLKQMRIQTTRNVLQQMLLQEAARKSNQLMQATPPAPQATPPAPESTPPTP